MPLTCFVLLLRLGLQHAAEVHVSPVGDDEPASVADARRIGEAVAERIQSLNLVGGTIICLGDSITHGGGLPGEGTAEGDTYPAVVAQLLDTP
jgi:hypothetical protein